MGKVSYDVTDKKLKREFEEFGPIRRVRIVTDKSGGCTCLGAAFLSDADAHGAAFEKPLAGDLAAVHSLRREDGALAEWSSPG